MIFAYTSLEQHMYKNQLQELGHEEHNRCKTKIRKILLELYLLDSIIQAYT